MTYLIQNEQELEQRLSVATVDDVSAAAALEGDLIILGVGGKMGPSLALLAKNAMRQANSKARLIAVARFTDPNVKKQLDDAGIETISCDLLDEAALAALPDAPNAIYMAARKFGTNGSEYLTWALNSYLPARVAERYRASRIVAFSTGNVYPLRSVVRGGARESDAVGPVGEYAQSALGRERLLEHMSRRWQTPMAILRLNYAIDMRYGVLADIGRAVFQRQPVDLRMGAVNVIWQRDANSVCFRSLAHCAVPPLVLNVSGPETLSVRYIAHEFGLRFAVEPIFSGEEGEAALLTNAALAHQLFGYPTVCARELIDLTAHWIKIAGRTLDKPTKFETRDGQF